MMSDVTTKNCNDITMYRLDVSSHTYGMTKS